MKRRGQTEVPVTAAATAQASSIITTSPDQHIKHENFLPDGFQRPRVESGHVKINQDGHGGLQPSELLSREARDGRFSLQNVLSISSLLRSDSDEPPDDEPYAPGAQFGPNDPIRNNILSYPVALGLYEKWVA